MKDWQHGIEMDILLQQEEKYHERNEETLSPFYQMKKNRIAEAIHRKEYYSGPGWAFQMKISKVKSDLSMFTKKRKNPVTFGRKYPGDMTIRHITCPSAANFHEMANVIRDFARSWHGDIFFETLELPEISSLGYNPEALIIERSHAKFIGSKINTHGDVIGFYRKAWGAVLRDETRPIFSVPDEEFWGIERLNVPDFSVHCRDLEKQIQQSAFQFTDHYSNYNEKKTWSALSLRGYTEDPNFITKPIEMNKKWKKENEDREFELQDTKARRVFDSCEPILQFFESLTELHRVRLMNLSESHGVLGKHTDQVDPEHGVQDGELMRFHVPIVTNEHVMFYTWDNKNNVEAVHMPVGSCFYLDVRKAHRAENLGQQKRTHLVFDVGANESVRSLIKNKETQ